MGNDVVTEKLGTMRGCRVRFAAFGLIAVVLWPGARVMGGGAAAGNFAATVIEYVEGSGVPIDSITLEKFNDPSTALGPPTVDTTGDGFNTGPPTAAVPVLPVNPPFRRFEIVSIGGGGRLTVRFDEPVVDDPRNPCGIDLILFGNTVQVLGGGVLWQNGDPNAAVVQSANLTAEAAAVAVSQDGAAWETFSSGPFADGFAPTLGRVYDPDDPDPVLGAWNEWWGEPTCPLLPLNPGLGPADFVGKTVAEVARAYGHSAGGTGFDLADVGLAWIRYVRIENPAGSGVTPEIDAMADVDAEAAPPDFDCDMDVDADDFGAFEACSTGPAMGPPAAGCERADLSGDGDVDQEDFGLFQRCNSGAGVPADPGCRQ